jgi:hypothetical protein
MIEHDIHVLVSIFCDVDDFHRAPYLPKEGALCG